MSHRTERRHRKKRRERNESPPSPCGESLDKSERVQRDFELFRSPVETATDLRLVRRAVNNDWDVVQQSRDWIIERVMGIVRQERGASEFESDRNSILACETMLDMYVAAFREREKIAASKMNRSRSPDGGDGEEIKESST